MTAVHHNFHQIASDALWAAVAWADGLGLPDEDPRAEQTATLGPRGWCNWIPVGLNKAPLVREWRHLSAQGLRSPRIGLVAHAASGFNPHALDLMIERASGSNPPGAYALLTGSGGLVVVDVDNPDLLPALIKLYGDTPVRTHTPSGGVHLYYLAPPDPESPDGVMVVKSRTAVRGPRSYDVKAAGGMCHMPGGESHIGRYTTPLPIKRWAPGELRAMLPVFPVDSYERDWLHHHPEAGEWSPTGTREDDAVFHADETVVLFTGERGTAAELWAAAVAEIGQAEEGERHDKCRRLGLRLGDRGCDYLTALDILRDWNRRNALPAADEEIERWAKDAFSSRKSALGHAVQPVEEEPEEVEDMSEEVGMPEVDFEEAANSAPTPAVAAKAEPATAPEYNLPDLDVDRLFVGVPGAAAWFKVAARHEALNVRPDAIAGFALCMASAAIAGRARLRIGDLQTPAYLFGIGETTSSRGKSLGLDLAGFDVVLEHYNKLNAPLEEREAMLLQRKRERLTSQIKALKAKADRAKGAEADKLDGEVVDLELELKGLERRRYLYIGGQDTPEAFLARIQEYAYGLLVSAEAKGVLQKYMHDGTDKLDALLMGHSEDKISIGLKGEWSDEAKRGVFLGRCGVVLAAQPTVLTPKTKEEATLFTNIAERGFFRRFLTFRPRRYKAGERPAPSTAEERAPLRAAWSALLRGLLAPIEGQDHPLVPSKPVIITASRQAEAMFLTFDDQMRDAAEGGDLAGPFLETFAGGAAQQAKRVALVLRLLRCVAEHGRMVACEIEQQDVAAALYLVRDYLLPHMNALAQRAVFSPVDDDLDELVKKLRERGGSAKRQDLLRGKGGLGRAWGLAEHGRTARVDRAAQQGVLLGRIVRVGDGKKGLPIEYRLVA